MYRSSYQQNGTSNFYTLGTEERVRPFNITPCKQCKLFPFVWSETCAKMMNDCNGKCGQATDCGNSKCCSPNCGGEYAKMRIGQRRSSEYYSYMRPSEAGCVSCDPLSKQAGKNLKF